MRAGTATKIVLNLISTLSMVNTGRVLGNQMIHMKTSNEKLKARALKLVIDLAKIDEKTAKLELQKLNWNTASVLKKYLGNI